MQVPLQWGVLSENENCLLAATVQPARQLHQGDCLSLTSGCSLLQEDAQKPDTDFKANLVNSVCFIIQFFIQLSTFAVNYMGHPHNASLRENRPLFSTILYSTAFISALLFDIPQGLASWFSLVSAEKAAACFASPLSLSQNLISCCSNSFTGHH